MERKTSAGENRKRRSRGRHGAGRAQNSAEMRRKNEEWEISLIGAAPEKNAEYRGKSRGQKNSYGVERENRRSSVFGSDNRKKRRRGHAGADLMLLIEFAALLLLLILFVWKEQANVRAAVNGFFGRAQTEAEAMLSGDANANAADTGGERNGTAAGGETPGEGRQMAGGGTNSAGNAVNTGTETGGLGTDETGGNDSEIGISGEHTEINGLEGTALNPNESETMPAEPAEPVTMLFAGDIYFSDYVLNSYDDNGGISGVIGAEYQNEIASADVFMANLEFPFSERGEAAADKEFTFRVSPSRANILSELGVNIVTLANNHMLDYGTDALLDTLDTLDAAGISHTGAGRNIEEAQAAVIKEVNGQRIAFLGASRVAPLITWGAASERAGLLLAYDAERLLSQVRAFNESCDYVVVYMHWGAEQEEMPKEYVRALAKQIADAGADLIIGAHPHVLQGTEYYNGVPIVYSLGNFLFGSSIPKTMLLKAVWDPNTGETALRMYPGKGSFGYTRVLSEESGKQAFYEWYQNISFGISVDGAGNILTE